MAPRGIQLLSVMLSQNQVNRQTIYKCITAEHTEHAKLSQSTLSTYIMRSQMNPQTINHQP